MEKHTGKQPWGANGQIKWEWSQECVVICWIQQPNQAQLSCMLCNAISNYMFKTKK